MATDRGSGNASDGDAEITLGLLNAVQENSTITQRSVANELGIALGLANAYLKRCVRKGLIKISQVPPNRYAYYLTPRGFSEKTRLTSEYLSSSFTFFRRARGQCGDALDYCTARDWTNIALAGCGELAEIATLCAGEHEITLIGMIDQETSAKTFAGLKVVKSPKKLDKLDAILITDLRTPQAIFDSLSKSLPVERILTPPLLGVARQEPETQP